jgi:hypothetical protein
MDYVAERLGISNVEDWYGVTSNHLLDNGASSMLKYFQYSSYNAIRSAYQDTEWLPWLFDHSQSSIWEDQETRRNYFDWLALQFKFDTPEDWYGLKKTDILDRGGGRLLDDYYNGSIARAICSIYPEFQWQPWRFTNVPSSFWRTLENQKIFMEWIEKKLEIKDPDGWIGVGTETLSQWGGSGLLYQYGHSITKILKAVFPHVDWKPWLLEKLPMTYWKSLERRREFIIWLGEHCGFERDYDWYKLDRSAVLENGGEGLLEYYDGSGKRAIMEIFPDVHWQPWLFGEVPLDYWKVPSNQRIYFDWLAEQMRMERVISYKRHYFDIIIVFLT